jgi:hypothetical protein
MSEGFQIPPEDMFVLDGLHEANVLKILTGERMTAAINGNQPDGYKLRDAENVFPVSDQNYTSKM